MEKVICEICGSELEVEDGSIEFECQFCGHHQRLNYQPEELKVALENAKSIFGNETYMTNPAIVSRIRKIAQLADENIIEKRCDTIIEILQKKNQEELDALVMQIANSLDSVNNHFSELMEGQKKVADAIEALKGYREKKAKRAIDIQLEIDRINSPLNIDLFKGRKVDELKRSLVSIEADMRDDDNKMAEVSRGWSQMYYEKLMMIVAEQNRQKAIRNRIKALESFQALDGSELSIDDPHYLNLAALNNDLSGVVKGTLLNFGKYKNEPLVWRVVGFNESRVLVISENVIEVGAYHHGAYSTKGYESSDVRKWLNSQLIYDLFSSAELKSIDVIGSDRLFLLDAAQMQFMFKDDKDRKAVPTAYAIKKGVNFTIKGKEITAAYWLSTINETTMNKFAYTVESDGHISKQDGVVNTNTYGIRPALWLSIKK